MMCNTENHLPSGGTTRRGLGIPALISNQENALQVCPQGSLMEAISQLRFPLRWCVKLTTRITVTSLPLIN